MTVGPSSGKIYWQRIEFTGRVVRDITTGSGSQSIEQMKSTEHVSGGRLLLNWMMHLLDDNESGSIDENEIPTEKMAVLDTNQDGRTYCISIYCCCLLIICDKKPSHSSLQVYFF